MGRLHALSRLALAATLCLSWSACDDAADNGPIDGDTATAPTDTVTTDTVGADTEPPPRVYPTLPLVDPLPIDPAFDPDYVSVGDAVVSTLVETLRPRYGHHRYVDADVTSVRVPLDAFGRLMPQPGEPHRLRHQLALPPELDANETDPAALPSTARSLLWTFVMADPQFVDGDAPAQTPKNASFSLSGFTLPAYRPQGELVPHVNDALVRSANRFAEDRPFDAVMLAGDLVENGIGTELGWLLSVLQGGVVSTDSGARDDVVPGAANDAFDPFEALGFVAGTPWIAAIGNHDIQINGNFPAGLIQGMHADTELLDDVQTNVFGVLGLTTPGDPLADVSPGWLPHRDRAAFRVDMDDFHPHQIPSKEELAALGPEFVGTDPARAPVDICGFVELMQGATGLPLGHGYSAQAVERCTGWFAFDPVEGLPVRILSLALGPVQGGPFGILAPPQVDGVIDDAKAGDPTYDQVAFLEAELDRAEADDVAVIVLTHQSSEEMRTGSILQTLKAALTSYPAMLALIDTWAPQPIDAVDTEEFRAWLASHPNVIGHVAGHNHRNTIRAICADGTERAGDDAPCAAGTNGETGYWEILTAAGVNYPHQGRFLEVVQLDGRLGALVLTMLDPRIPANSFAEKGRFVALATEQLKSGGASRLGHVLDRNVVLPFAVPMAIAEAWGKAPTASATIQSTTTLRAQKAALPSLPVWVEQ